ncbi:uncharacterized protein LOC132293687 [Cornus florida]|uniref:uncharacterized protein LOC132293687 n=1 Tax=Cornus florida TaxID=4283 RepID=UPI002899B00B|nr:uncharacterized protein LOC132293687 [Cornus florida]
MKMGSNLQSFLHSATPNVPSKRIPQRCNLVGKDTIEYFTLGDLWDCYKEWSAFGVGTPVVLNNGEDVVQYYAPYLSAIQIYTNKSSPTLRNTGEDSDLAECESESWSDDSESDKLSGTLSNHSCKIWDTTSPDSNFDQDGSSPLRDRLGSLYLQYYEMRSPYWRIPLTEKITDLAQNCLGLLTLKSIDLSPASWMAIAWYPIYHIPTKGNVKELSTCFLTYHTLSSSFQDAALENYEDIGKDIPCSGVVEEILGCKSKGKESDGVSLPPFGLATYKMQGDLWMKPDTSDHERLMYLHSAADSWLKQLSVQHHDFSYFTSHCTMDIGTSL